MACFGTVLWQAELTFILFFQMSEIFIPDIWKKTILDIPNQVRILDIQKVILDIKNNNFGYPKINIYFRYQK